MSDLVTKVFENELALTDGEKSLTQEIVTERETNNGVYCSYRAYQGMVWKALEDKDICTDYLNERLYFRALEKIGVVVRGKLVKGKVVPSKTGVQLPVGNFAVDLIALSDAEGNGELGIYARKRGTFGFNCANQVEVAEKVLKPVVKLLSDLVEEIETKVASIENNKAQLKAMGVSVSDAKQVTTKRLIDKYL